MIDVQMAPTPYTAAGTAMPPMGNPPVLGQQIPGMSGGLPAQGGLSVKANPMAEQLRSYGRGDDSMLIHMTPNEVNSLQGLAMAHGGSLTINPETGLPEAGWLGKLLPMVLGAALAATGVGAPLAAGLVGAGQFARTGSLKKGLMAGLGAFGGAGMAGAAGVGGSLLGGNAGGLLSSNAGVFGANMGAGALAPGLTNVTGVVNGATQATNAINPASLSSVQSTTLPITNGAFGSSTGFAAAPAATTGAAAGAATGAATTGASTGAQFTGGIGSRFGQAVRAGLPQGTPGFIASRAPMLAGMGALSTIASAATPSTGGTMGSDGVIDNSYQGPYYSPQRKATFADSTADILSSSKQRRYFDTSMPEVYNNMGQLVEPGSNTARGTPIMQSTLNSKAKKGENRYSYAYSPYGGGLDPQEGYARGGEVDMRDGSFVVDARTVSELGNGSSNAGMELLARMGGRPLQGKGDGVSDSIPARIGGKQEARVARDEVLFPPEAVRRMGKGSEKRGTEKLYSLMNKAHKARKKAKRGQDTGLRRGLA